MFKKVVGSVHEKAVFGRRVRVLIEMFNDRLRDQKTVLDVGAGSGDIASHFNNSNGDLEVSGIDVFVRENTAIPVIEFDGKVIPFEDDSFDAITIVDVLHHTDDGGETILKEAARVARNKVIVKDHLSESIVDRITLRAMDWVGNAPHGVVLPYNYSPKSKWDEWLITANLETVDHTTKVPLYGFPLNLVFGRKLHFVGVFQPEQLVS